MSKILAIMGIYNFWLITISGKVFLLIFLTAEFCVWI